MSTALIGYSGFVGQTLLRAASFDHLYRSTNIQDITGHSFDLVVCAGAPAQKWLANKEPAADARSIDSLMGCLRTIQASRFVLVSTVDVFGKPVCVDETCAVETEGLHPYGFNRWRLEQFVRSTFAEALIIRLPGLVGHGLKKNILFDFLNDNNLHNINAQDVFQFYPMVHLWEDIVKCLNLGLDLVHLTAAPVDVARVAKQGFGLDFENTLSRPAIRYDFRSIHAGYWGKKDYQYSAEDSLAAIREYAQTEPRRIQA